MFFVNLKRSCCDFSLTKFGKLLNSLDLTHVSRIATPKRGKQQTKSEDGEYVLKDNPTPPANRLC